MTEDISMARMVDAFYMYSHARRWGRWHHALAALRGGSSHPLDLGAVSPARIRARHAVGDRTVPIRQIVGSEGRSRDFDADFHPLGRHTRSGWKRIAEASLRGASFPPVELIHVGDSYFVRDGHHRVSVAAHLGQEEIDAVVTECQVTRLPSSEHPPQAERPQRQAHPGATLRRGIGGAASTLRAALVGFF